MKHGALIRAFALEVLDAVHVLMLFADAAIEPSGVMGEHVCALRELHNICLITSRPKDVLMNLDAWEESETEYQRLRQFLYGSKPKAHIGRHVVDSTREHEVYMTCWAPERDHSYSKAIAKNCFNKCCKTILDRSNHHFQQALLHDVNLLREVHLVDPSPCMSFQKQLGPHSAVQASRVCMTHVDCLQRGRFARVLVGTESFALLKVEVFLEVCVPNAACAFLVLGDANDRVAGRSKAWAPARRVVSTPVDRIVRRELVYIDPDGCIVATVCNK